MAQLAEAGIGSAEFTDLTEPFRRELLAHCYRMLGSVDEAEDLVQETYLRAWRYYRGFEGRSSVRTWLYQIATNACLSALARGARRPLPSGLGPPGEEPLSAPAENGWLQPIPDQLVIAESSDPAAVAVARESLRLALIAALQNLPARQRAVLILREVLSFPAADVATMLGTTTAAVKSALQRARVRLDLASPRPDQIAEPVDPIARALLDRYIAAFENADAEGLRRVLSDDISLELPPSSTWYAAAGAAACAVAGLESAGNWRMVPTAANGQPAAATYHRDPDGIYQAYGVVVLTVTSTAIARITVFADAGLLARFGLPAQLH